MDKTVHIIAGPNGSGKTTFAKELLGEHNRPFVNADEIAIALRPNHLNEVRIQSGKIFFGELKRYIAQKQSFVVETTLSGRYFVRLIRKLKEHSFRVKLIYIFVETVEEAIHRIDIRVKKGGHPVPPADIIRRFYRSKHNFWHTYRTMVDSWELFLNSKDEFLQVAVGAGDTLEIIDEDSFSLFQKGLEHDKN